MSRPILKPQPDPHRTVYVTVQDRKTRKSRCLTLYGVTVAEAIQMIRRSLEADAEATPEEARDSKAA